MAYIDKITVGIENDIYNNIFSNDPEYTRKQFKKYKQTDEFKQLFNTLFNEKMEDIYNSDKNKQILKIINKFKEKSEDESVEGESEE